MERQWKVLNSLLWRPQVAEAGMQVLHSEALTEVFKSILLAPSSGRCRNAGIVF